MTSGDTFWNHGGVARAEQGTGGKSTGRDRGFVYKVEDRGQNIDEVHTFFEEACARVSRFSRCEMITRAPPRHLCIAAVVLV